MSHATNSTARFGGSSLVARAMRLRWRERQAISRHASCLPPSGSRLRIYAEIPPSESANCLIAFRSASVTRIFKKNLRRSLTALTIVLTPPPVWPQRGSLVCELSGGRRADWSVDSIMIFPSAESLLVFGNGFANDRVTGMEGYGRASLSGGESERPGEKLIKNSFARL